METLSRVTRYLDRYLNIEKIQDWSQAINGLQLEGGAKVRKIGAAVDACPYTIEKAVEMKIDMLIVHHGLFWSEMQPLTGSYLKKIKTALEGGLSIYSAHLPLDVHPVVGNNHLLCMALGFKKTSPFFFDKGQLIGLKTKANLSRSELAARLKKAVGSEVKLCPGGPDKIHNIGVITGGAGGEIYRIAKEGVDTFITGEGPHWSYTAAEELGINVLYGGHYATETFGVKALAAHLASRFKMQWEFIDHPTGL